MSKICVLAATFFYFVASTSVFAEDQADPRQEPRLESWLTKRLTITGKAEHSNKVLRIKQRSETTRKTDENHIFNVGAEYSITPAMTFPLLLSHV